MLRALMVTLALFAGACSGRPAERDGNRAFGQWLAGQVEPAPHLLTRFAKTDGISRELNGVHVYVMQFEADVSWPEGLHPECLRRGQEFQGWDRFFQCNFQGGALEPQSVLSRVTYRGEVVFEQTERRWAARQIGIQSTTSLATGVTPCPTVAAAVNGSPICVQDVRSLAVMRGMLRETEDLAVASPAFQLAVEELIQIRLFAMEAARQGLDQRRDIQDQLENVRGESERERVLAAAIRAEIGNRAPNPSAVEEAYRTHASRLASGAEVHLRHIECSTRELADTAKRRLDNGERFEALAFELSADRETSLDGGDLGWTLIADLNAPFRTALADVDNGTVVGPIEVENRWHLVRLEDRRVRGGVPSLEEMRPQIVSWLQQQEIVRLQERLERNARIQRLRVH